MLKKILLAVLACITIFLSKRAFTDERRLNAAKDGAPDATAVAAKRPIRTAGLY